MFTRDPASGTWSRAGASGNDQPLWSVAVSADTLVAGDPDLLGTSGGVAHTFPLLGVCDDRIATRLGTHNADTLVGTGNDDVIVALAGNDMVTGGGGNDLICLNNGNDTAEAAPTPPATPAATDPS